MAIAAIQGFACRNNLTFHRRLVRSVYKVQRSNYAPALESTVEPLSEAPRQKLIASRGGDNGDSEAPQWKKLNSKDLGIRTSKITKPARFVLNVLKKNGYDVYLVGGCVRDLILKRTPKDFDIITTAELREVLRTFLRCEIVGKRFPICHVHVDETIIEVSSFSTSGKTFGRTSNYGFRKPAGCSEPDFIRWKNCIRRDFTINGLMFDPFSKTVYDYTGGMEDIRNAKVRSVIPADTSFVEDCARILRGVRIAARLGFRLSKETSHFVKDLSYSLLRLDKGRILMELNYMLAYGSAEASLRLLWKFGLLEILLPIQAAYFVSQGFRRRDKRYNMLLALFGNLDKLVAPDRPCHSCLWVGMLAFHKALVDKPRDPLVVAAFCLAIHNGGGLSSAVDVAATITKPHDPTFSSELLLSEPKPMSSRLMKNKKEALLLMKEEVMDLAASVELALNKMCDEDFVSRALEKYPQAPRSDMVFISWSLGMKVCSIFECARGKGGSTWSRRGRGRGREIDYEGLGAGRVSEVRHLFARLVFDTVYPTTSTLD